MDFFKTLKKAEWLNLLLSLVFIIIGAILVKDPEGVLKTVSLIAGIVFLVLYHMCVVWQVNFFCFLNICNRLFIIFFKKPFRRYSFYF